MNGGTGVDVVDLTDDSPTVRTQPITTTVQPAPVKKRSLPMSVLPPAHGNGMQPVPNRLPLPSISTLPTAVRTLPPSLTVPNALLSHQQPNRLTAPVLPNAKIVFSIVNSRQFTARAEIGTVSPALLQTFKMIPEAKFDWQTCKWLFPLSAHDNLHVALRTQHRHNVEPLPRLTLAAAQLKNQRDEQLALSGGQWDPEESLLALKGHIPDSVLHQLAPFQRDAVKFIMSNKGRALVADEMGLGKTRTAISAAMAYRDDWPLLIVCPSSARHHWQAELLAVLHPDHIEPRDISIVESSSHPIYKGSRDFKYKVLIISYHLVSKAVETLLEIPFHVIVVDESHYMKSATAQRTRCLLPLLHRSRRAILLSGTPALSRPIELFTQLHALAPRQWSDMKEYGKRYCRVSKAEMKARLAQLQAQGGAAGGSAFGGSGGSSSGGSGGGRGWSEFSGASNTEELHMMLTATLMIRRLKKDILAQLPEKKRRIVRVEIADPKRRSELLDMLALSETYNQRLAAHKKSRAEGAAREREQAELEELRQRKKHVLMQLFTLSGEAKLPGVLTHLQAFLNDPLSGKVLVFCHHRTVMDALAQLMTQRGEDYIRIDGRTASKERHGRVQLFQTNAQCRVALLAITAAGIALTLTAASTVFFAELFWTPAALLQAEDRAHRIGQVNTVQVTYFLAAGSVDKLLWPMVRQKMKLLGEIVEGSKDGDFLADLDGPPDQSQSTADDKGGDGGAIKREEDGGEGQEDVVGEKRVKSETAEEDGIKADVGDLAHEIATELRHAARKDASAAGSESSDAEDGEGSDQESVDEEAVVRIEEPDPLAQLYISMCRNRSQRGKASTVPVAPAMLGAWTGAPLQMVPAGLPSMPVSLLSPVHGAPYGSGAGMGYVGYGGNSGSGSGSGVGLGAQNGYSGYGGVKATTVDASFWASNINSIPVSMPTDPAAYAAGSGEGDMRVCGGGSAAGTEFIDLMSEGPTGAQKVPSGEALVIDLLDDDDVNAEVLMQGMNSSIGGGVVDGGMGGSASMDALAAQFLADDVPFGDDPAVGSGEGGRGYDIGSSSSSSGDVWGPPTQSTVTTATQDNSIADATPWTAPPPPPPPVYSSSIVQDEDSAAFPEPTNAQVLQALAQQAWSAAAPTPVMKENKMKAKFTPTLKKAGESSGSLNTAAVAKPSVLTTPESSVHQNGHDSQTSGATTAATEEANSAAAFLV